MRYIRQTQFNKIGEENQKLIEQSTVTIIGVGALGTNSADLLARSGVKKLILVDNDIIEEHNLQRQRLFNEKDVGKLKVEAAKEHLSKINSNIKIETKAIRLDPKNINEIKSDLILDCTDNFETRYLINEYCKKNKFTWIFSTATGSTGMVYVIQNEPCFRCIFPEPTEDIPTCEEEGILNTLASTVSSIQVTEALKVITKQEPTKELIHIDIWNNEINKIKVNKNKDCEVCKNNFKYLNKESNMLAKPCKSRGAYIVQRNVTLDFKKLQKLNIVAQTPVVVIIKDKYEVACYKNGKLMIKNCPNEKEAEEQAEKIYKLFNSSQ